MNDFTTLTKAVATAEEILKEYSVSTERVIKSKSATVLGQVCEYLYNVLNECDFTKLQIQCNTSPECRKPETPGGYCGINSGENYLVNGTTYHACLYIHTKTSMRVYFNHDSIMIRDNETNDTILTLCYYWKKLKANLDIAIKRSLELRLNEVKREAEIKKSHTALIDSFEL